MFGGYQSEIESKKYKGVNYMTYELDGKVAIITGGAGGLGREISLAMHKAGATVVIADINHIEGPKLAEEIKKASGKSEYIKLDVTNSKNVREMCDKVVALFGRIDILINCAGITKRMEPLEFPEEVFDKIIAVNLKGTFLCAQAAARYMTKQGGGKIINIVSIGGMGALPNTVAYCASKGGVVNMTKALAIDLAKYKINVNAIAPALTKTPIAKQVFQDKSTLDWFTSRTPLGRLCEPEDIGNAVLFLSSSVSDFITGHILAVDGGWLAQ